MADKEISGLATAGAIAGTELMHVVQSGNSRQTTPQKIIDTLAEPLGKLRLNAQTVSYTLVLGDAGKTIEVNSGSAKVITLPPNASVAFATDTYVKVTRYGAGSVTITGDTGVILNGVSAGSITIPNQFGELILHKRDTNEWTARIPGGGMTLLNSGTVSAAATLDIVLTGYTAYRGLIFKLINFVPVTDGAEFWVRTSTDGGSTYSAGASDYIWSYMRPGVTANDVADSKIKVYNSIDNSSVTGLSASIEVLGQTASVIARFIFTATVFDSSSNFYPVFGTGARNANADVDAVRFMFSSGNISTGTWALYGLT